MGSDTYDAVKPTVGPFPPQLTSRSRILWAAWCLAQRHPAVRFLLLLAIADDAAGLIILAIFYPSE